MKERSIVLGDADVWTILDGQQTQLRLPIKRDFMHDPNGPKRARWYIRRPDAIWDSFETIEALVRKYCPFAGYDRLWVREAVCLRPGGYGYRADNDPDNNPKRWCPSVQMPRKAARIFLQATNIRAERIQAISEEDAIACGFTAKRVAETLLPLTRNVKTAYMRWLINPETGEEREDDYCPECAHEIAKAEGLKVGGWDESFERDGPSWCSECDTLLNVSLTEHGVDYELDIGLDGRKASPVEGADAAILCHLAWGIGDLQERHKGRLAQIGFATAWDVKAKEGYTWENNPWAWVIDFNIKLDG